LQSLRFLKWGLGLVFVFVVFVNAYVYLHTRPYILRHVATVPQKQVALILGAAVYSNGTLSVVFENRVDKAIELYQKRKVQKILVSGDNSTAFHNEVDPVRTYLLRQGIPDSDIFLDYAGFDTYSTMYRAREIFQVSSMIIVTQSFHLPRAIFLARSLGLDAYGVPALSGEKEFANYAREIFANEKAFFNVIFERKPKFLGAPIPITGTQEKRDN